ncbi:MAG: hypothetical protein PVJ84_01985 [Desulfobacteraceae bacterium]|jgi:hypothetical protein
MKVIFYSTTVNGCAAGLMDRVVSVVSQEQVYFTNRIENFMRALIKYRIVGPIVVMCISSIADVEEIKELGNVLDDLFLIIITDNSDTDVFKSCRRLYPRLLSHCQEDLGIVTAVLEKRLDGLCQSNPLNKEL